jgi:hypothetical protein
MVEFSVWYLREKDQERLIGRIVGRQVRRASFLIVVPVKWQSVFSISKIFSRK